MSSNGLGYSYFDTAAIVAIPGRLRKSVSRKRFGYQTQPWVNAGSSISSNTLWRMREPLCSCWIGTTRLQWLCSIFVDFLLRNGEWHRAIARRAAPANETFQETKPSVEMKAGDFSSARNGRIDARGAGIHSRENDGNLHHVN